MNCEREAHRIAHNIKSFARRNPSVSHNTKREVDGMLEFLLWLSVSMPDAYVKDGGDLFRLYAMRDEAFLMN